MGVVPPVFGRLTAVERLRTVSRCNVHLIIVVGLRPVHDSKVEIEKFRDSRRPMDRYRHDVRLYQLIIKRTKTQLFFLHEVCELFDYVHARLIGAI